MEWWYLPYIFPVWDLSPKDCKLIFAAIYEAYNLKEEYFCSEKSQLTLSSLEGLWLGTERMPDQCKKAEMEPGWNLGNPLGLIEEQRKHSMVFFFFFFSNCVHLSSSGRSYMANWWNEYFPLPVPKQISALTQLSVISCVACPGPGSGWMCWATSICFWT